jgi:hypothetical protein
MAKSEVPRIDNMLDGTNTAPLDPANSDTEKAAVGILQDLLKCHGAKGLPNVRSKNYGVFDATTVKRLGEFRLKYKLQKAGDPVVLDVATLKKLITEPAVSPVANQGYLALSLDFVNTGLLRVISFITIAEGAGRFDAFNKNTDKQGLSYGLIQWAQKPGRLKDILKAFQGPPTTVHRLTFYSVFTAAGDGMVTHTQKPNGGVDPSTGKTTDTNFDLVGPIWKERFNKAAKIKVFQQIQVAVAKNAFKKTVRMLRTYAAPSSPVPDPLRKIHSERGFAFMMDVANQHGDNGTKKIYEKVVKPEMNEDQAMEAIQKKSVEILVAKYGKGSNEEKSTQERREFFRTTTLLSKDIDFDENEPIFLWPPILP